MKKKILFGLILFIIILGYIISVIIINKNKAKNVDESSGKFEILASFYPMYITCLNIADGVDGVKVENLTEPTTGCLEDYQISPNEMIKIKSASVFVINGAGMENFLNKVMSTYPNLNILDSSKNIDLLKNDDEVSNPHLWLDINDYIKQINNITDGIIKADPKNAEKYRKNADIYIEKVNKEKDKMVEGLKNINQRNIVTFHEAFPYFAKEFNLNIVASIEREPGTEPSPDELTDTINIVKKSNTRALFAEPQYSRNAADVIARQTGATVYILDPIVTGNYDKNAYLDAMDKNLLVLQEALK